jgi:hypothetical protein
MAIDTLATLKSGLLSGVEGILTSLKSSQIKFPPPKIPVQPDAKIIAKPLPELVAELNIR